MHSLVVDSGRQPQVTLFHFGNATLLLVTLVAKPGFNVFPMPTTPGHRIIEVLYYYTPPYATL